VKNKALHNYPAAIGILGGTFDPVHFGHLRSAIECANAFGLSEVRLMPCHPVHRNPPVASAADRKKMLELAVENASVIVVDDRELQQSHATYSIDTLRAIRAEVGPDVALYFAVGIDAFNDIETWKDWQQLFTLANFIVMSRPATVLAISNPVIKERITVFAGIHQSAGCIYELAVSALDISATKIRQLVKQHQSIEYLLPDTVQHYIHQQELYQ
jgi:nicotinate-nucleotide adenylyltransferase